MLGDHWNLIYHINFYIPDVGKHVPLIFLNCVFCLESSNCLININLGVVIIFKFIYKWWLYFSCLMLWVPFVRCHLIILFVRLAMLISTFSKNCYYFLCWFVRGVFCVGFFVLFIRISMRYLTIKTHKIKQEKCTSTVYMKLNIIITPSRGQFHRDRQALKMMHMASKSFC